MLEMLDDLFKDQSPTAAATLEADEIILIADRSGSMSSIREDAQGGINEFVRSQKKEPGEANFTLVEFDTQIDAVYKQTDIKHVADYELQPRGGTALYDAIGMTLFNADEIKTTGKKICVIVTDGDENSSREWSQQAVFDRIEELKEKGWDFLFLAANQDAMSTGMSLGMDAGETVTFDASAVGAASAYAATTNYVGNLRGGLSKSATIDMLDADLANMEGLGKSAVGDIDLSETSEDESEK